MNTQIREKLDAGTLRWSFSESTKSANFLISTWQNCDNIICWMRHMRDDSNHLEKNEL
jgi:hypothetical protein